MKKTISLAGSTKILAGTGFDPNNQLETAVADLLNCSYEEKQQYELSVQKALNQGADFTEEQNSLLMTGGYLITTNPEIIKNFADFSIPNNPEFTEAVRGAVDSGKLLLDKFKVYRPGTEPALALGGAAKGYAEIFSVVEKQSNEKQKIAEKIGQLLKSFFLAYPDWLEHREKLSIVDLGCGNGFQTRLILKELRSALPVEKKHLDFEVICIDNQPGSAEKGLAYLEELPDVVAEFYTANLFDDLETIINTNPQAILRPQGQSADLVIAAHVYFPPARTNEFANIVHNLLSSGGLALLVHGATGSDGDKIASARKEYMRGKPASDLTKQLQNEFTNQFSCPTEINHLTAEISFPNPDNCLRRAFTDIRIGDYENKYIGASQDFIIFKALMEFFASFPLESMTQNQRLEYFQDLQSYFQINKGDHLIIHNNLLLARGKSDYVPYGNLCQIL